MIAKYSLLNQSRQERLTPAKQLLLDEKLFQNHFLICSAERKPCVLSQFYQWTGFQYNPLHSPAHSPMRLMGRLSLAADTMAEQMVAAPPMSALMRSIFAEGLMEMPPLGGKRTMCSVNTQTRATVLKRINTLGVSTTQKHHLPGRESSNSNRESERLQYFKR